jgi:hypothetical protein
VISYFSLFPEKCATELRTAAFPNNRDMPSGTIIFNEYFCPDLNCNCERVLIGCEQVLAEGSVPKPYATISYSWNTQPDASWRKLLDEGNPFIDPFHPNKKFAKNLMDFWFHMYERDTKYRERILRHYHELRNSIGDKYTTPDGSGMTAAMEKDLTSVIKAEQSQNSVLLLDPMEIKKKDRVRHKELQRKLLARRKPK